MDLNNYIDNLKNKKCSFCFKDCKSNHLCLITQIMNELNKERENTKYKAVSFVTLLKKLKGRSDLELQVCLSNCKDYRHRTGQDFGKCFWGSLKSK